jgi:hypothetical protein
MEADKAEEEYRIVRSMVELAEGQAGTYLPSDLIDLIDLKIVEGGGTQERPLTRVARTDLFKSERLQQQAMCPTSYAVHRGVPSDTWHTDVETAFGSAPFGVGAPGGAVPSTAIGAPGDQIVVIFDRKIPAGLWDLHFWGLRTTKAVASIEGQVDASRYFLEAITAGLAARIAQKFNIERHGALLGEFDRQWKRARIESRPRTDVVIAARAHGWSRRRRH